MLQRERWNVLQAATATEAARIAVRHAPIDLLIADVVLRDGTGTAVAQQMIERNPNILCVLISGYPWIDLCHRGCLSEELLAHRNVEFLHKPFTIRALLELLGRMSSQAA